MRAGGGTLFGNPDFYHLNRMGGNMQVRGYERERFYGKSMAFIQTQKSGGLPIPKTIFSTAVPA